MKTMVYSLLLIFAVLSMCSYLQPAEAAPVGSPASLLKKGDWNFSLGGGYVYERPLETGGAKDYHANLTYGYHSRSYGITDRLSITGKIGGSYGYLYDETTVVGGTETSLSGGLALGIQLKGIVYEHKDSGWELDASGQFLYLRSHHKSSGKANADWYEGQIASCVAKKIGSRFKPFVGLRYSTVNLDYEDGLGNETSYDEDGGFGLVAGFDVYFGEARDIVINIESSFLTGIEFFAIGRYRF
ncbi:hypothetical protein ACFL1I_00950 [Candidatus Omnitrophota bacterium]